MKLKKIICTIVLVILMLGNVLPVLAKDFNEIEMTEIDMNEYNLGFKVSVPSDFTVYSALEDESLAELGYFFDSSDTPTQEIPGYSVNVGYEENKTGITGLDNMTDEQKEAFKQEIVDATRERYGMTIEEELGVDLYIVGLTGEQPNSFLHVAFTSTGGGRIAYHDNYYAYIDGRIIRFSAIAFANEADEKYIDEVGTLAMNVAGRVVITGDIGETTPYSVEDMGGSGNTDTDTEILSNVEFPMWIFLLVVVAILLIGIKLSKRKEWQEEPFSLDKSKGIQGFCAVSIILHHMSQTIFFAGGDPQALKILLNAGVLFVGIFFFFSGYGLSKSRITKTNYLKGFLWKRLPTVIIPFLSCVLFFVLASILMGGRFSLLDLLRFFTGVTLINSHMWYIVEIVILYLAFFFIFRLIKNEKIAFAAMSVFCAALVVLGLFSGHGDFWFQGEWWFNTTMLFAGGLFFARFEEQILGFAKKCYVWLLPLSVVLFAGLFWANSYTIDKISYYVSPAQSAICLAVQLPMVITFVILVLLVMMKVKFCNPILKFLGTISLELYLVHNFFIENLRSSEFINIGSDSIYIALVLLCAIAVAVLISGFDKYLIALVGGRKKLTMQNEGKIHSIDAMRFIAAFLVVVIHIPFANTEANGILIAFGKTAVPFFLVVCGYFLWRDNNEDFMARLKKQTKRIFILTVVANIIYLFGALATYLMDKMPLNQFISSNFTVRNLISFVLWNMSPFGDHLWYLGSLLYALLVLMLLCKLKIHKKVIFIAPLLLGGYIALSWLLNPRYYFMYRNAILCTLPYVMFGCMIARFREKLMRINVFWYLGAGALLCITNVLEFFLYKGDLSKPFFSAELLVYVMVLVLLKLPSLFEGTLIEKIGRECSLFVYIMHIAVYYAIMRISFKSAFFSTFTPVIVFVLTILLAVLWNLGKKVIKKGTKKSRKEVAK